MTMAMINEMMSFEQLDEVSGGAWGYSEIHNRQIYENCGVTTKWTCNPFVRDKFYYTEPGQDKAVQIEDATAAAICFYRMTADGGSDSKPSIFTALQYKSANAEAYIKFIQDTNKTNWCP